MRAFYLLIFLFLSLTFQSCQCADEPTVGPVEEEVEDEDEELEEED